MINGSGHEYQDISGEVTDDFKINSIGSDNLTQLSEEVTDVCYSLAAKDRVKFEYHYLRLKEKISLIKIGKKDVV